MKSVPMSKEGYHRLREDLERKEQVEWPAIVREIEIARAHGDLSENAEYHSAKEKQGQLDAQIRQLKDKLARAEIIDPGELKGDTVAFGAHVLVRNVDTGQEQTYHLVGPEETDLKTARISVLSPVGQALVGNTAGAVVEVKTPGGVRRLEIVEIGW